MNSGCYGNDISKVLLSITVIDINECKEKEIMRNEIEFFYRDTNLPSKFIIAHQVKLYRVKQKLKKLIEKKQRDFIEKEKTHTTKSTKACGSTF